MLDASGIEGRDPVEDFYKINKELELYSSKLAKRRQVIAANKIDLPQSEENLKRIEEMAQKEGLKVFPVSAATKEGLNDLMRYVYQMLQEYVEEPEEENQKKFIQLKKIMLMKSQSNVICLVMASLFLVNLWKNSLQ